jgi:lipopolysaccharide biosynthesis glycosyltransferase
MNQTDTGVIPIIVGFDQREAIAYHVFCQSAIEKATSPLCFIPLAMNNLTAPYLRDYSGWAIYVDGDMVVTEDIKKLWDLRDPSKAVMVVKHDYKTKAEIKYLGNPNQNYPRKNWSSVILWNCAHPKNRVLDPAFIQEHDGKFLHRFSWLDDAEIGALPKEWNWLAIEYPDNPAAKLVHYTLGTPCFEKYRNSAMTDLWQRSLLNVVSGMEWMPDSKK